METELKWFVERILQGLVYNNPLPGVGTSAHLGMFSSGSDVIQNLRRDTVAFARVYKNANMDMAKVAEAASHVEGGLKMAQALNVFSEKEAAGLLQALYDLMEKRQDIG